MKQIKPLLKKILLFTCFIGLLCCGQIHAAEAGQETLSQADHIPSIEKFMKVYNLKNALQLVALKVEQNDEQLQLFDNIGYEEERRKLGKRPILKTSNWATPFRKKTSFVIRLDRQLPLKLSFELLHVAGSDRQKVEELSYFIKKTEMDEQFLKADSTGRFTLKLRSITQVRSISFRLRQDQETHDIEFVLFDKKRPVTIEKK